MGKEETDAIQISKIEFIKTIKQDMQKKSKTTNLHDKLHSTSRRNIVCCLQ